MSELREQITKACRAWNDANTLGEHIGAGEVMHDILVRLLLHEERDDPDEAEENKNWIGWEQY